jgi:hypothetical protein
VIGAVGDLPGAAYITALHDLITAHNSTTRRKIAAVVVCAIIVFLLIIVPWAFLGLKPQAIKGHLCQ